PPSSTLFPYTTLFRSSLYLAYDKIFVTIQDSTWNMQSAGSTIIDSSGYVTVNPLVFTKNNQVLNIQGGLSNKPSERLDFNLRNLDRKRHTSELQSQSN